MTDLSLSAQAVLDAFLSDAENTGLQMDDLRENVAAALRAVADQVAPSDLDEPRNYLPMAMECQRIREELLAIAAELENGND